MNHTQILNQNLKNNLFKKIVSNNNNLNIQKFKKNGIDLLQPKDRK